MTASQPGTFNVQEFTDLGAPLVGGRLYTYTQGTTAHKTAYTDAAGAIPQTYTNDGLGGQYIALNSRGELPAPLYLAAGSYDLALKTAAGATVWTRRADPVGDTATALAASSGSSLVGFIQSGSGAVATTVQRKLRESVDVLDFGADPTGVADSYTALTNALATGKKVKLTNGGNYKCSGTLNFNGGKQLFGEGYGAGITYTGAGVAFLMTNGANVIDGVHLTTTPVATKGLHLLGASSNTIRDFIVSGNPANGVYLESTDDAAQTDWNTFDNLIVNNAVLPVALVASGTGAVNANTFRGPTNWRTSAASGGVVLYLNGGGYGIVGNNFYDIDLSGYTNNNSVVMDGPGASQTNFIGIQVDTGSLTGCVIGSGVTSTKWIGGSNQATTPFVQNNTAAQQSNDILLTSSKSFIGSIDIAAYTAPTLLNSWVNYGGDEAVAGYYKDALGIVHIKGLVKSGTTTPGTHIFVLPAGFCPTDNHWFATTSNGSFGAFVVALNGAVYVATAPSNTYFSIECSFRAGA